MTDFLKCDLSHLTMKDLFPALLTKTANGEWAIRTTEVNACAEDAINCSNNAITLDQALKLCIGLDPNCGKPALRLTNSQVDLVASIGQDGINPPQLSVLKNGFGNITVSRNGVGQYILTFPTGSFPDISKLYIPGMLNDVGNAVGGIPIIDNGTKVQSGWLSLIPIDNQSIEIDTFDMSGDPIEMSALISAQLFLPHIILFG